MKPNDTKRDHLGMNNTLVFRSFSIKALLFYIISFCLLLTSLNSFATPQFSAMTGNRCIRCHIVAQGGGLRNARGFMEYHDVGLLSAKDDSEINSRPRKNTSMGNRLTYGFDTRYQSARSHKTKDSDRKKFPMQASIYSSYRLSNMMLVEGVYSFGPNKFLGQQDWSGSVILQRRGDDSQLRIGFFQPSIGVRYDDHTLLARNIAGADGNTLIPVNFAEHGVELSWSKLGWLSLTAGSFESVNIAENRVNDADGSEMSLIEDKDERALLLRAVLRKRGLFKIFNPYAGISNYETGNFSLMNIFCGTGIAKRVSIVGEYAQSDKKNLRETENLTVEVMLKVTKALLLYVRAEDGTTHSFIGDHDIETFTRQGSVGAQIFLLPFLEFRPEWRIVDTERYKSSRYALQLHYFY